jgi:hypothetical protein
MVLKTVAVLTALYYALTLYADGGARWANCANGIDDGVRVPSSMCLQSLQSTMVAECKRSAWESSGSSLIKVEATRGNQRST